MKCDQCNKYTVTTTLKDGKRLCWDCYKKSQSTIQVKK